MLKFILRVTGPMHSLCHTSLFVVFIVYFRFLDNQKPLVLGVCGGPDIISWWQWMSGTTRDRTPQA